MYKVYVEKSAQKDLKKIPLDDLQRIVEEIKKLSLNTRPKGCRKLTGSKDDWRIRIGNYRVVYEIDDREKSIRVMIIRHRRNVYQ